ncbi:MULTISPECIES: winged helix-turn-helix domain-containing protein [Providencia]|uniref:winged helix-turn-helix domain-containing protein n=1 Tax=Providencia TaxID=586 RepID=UPI001C5AB00F|nr:MULTISPECIES: winged helix-turn-helix domain-containing protein [Providencia]ELR5151377.1 winged helix-turn-helix domain-containing protein [Providencia rettgeri]QXX82709.1 winged helix-turn-helix domain-containing protein [Providencia sp. R33]
MKYLINQHVTYDSYQGLLYTSDVDDAIKLTTTLNRLLLVLAQNNGEVLDRETLLRRVWEEHNQVVSDNNLNSSVSVLRRHLSSFFDEEVISTIPKVGIKFSADLMFITPDEQPEEQSEETTLEAAPSLSTSFEPPIESNEQNEIKSEAPVKKSYILNNRYLEITLIVVIIFCLLYLFKSYFFANRTEYPEVGQIDQCTIRYINSYHKADTRSMSFSVLKERLENLGINCKKPATVFYYNVGIITQNKNFNDDYLFLSYCPKTAKDGATISCENFYVK